MGHVDLSPVGILTIVLEVGIIFFSLSVHESAHGWMADKLGDHTARMLGRITLNPIPHIDPIGTILVPVVLAIIGAPIFGWAKPVPIISRNFKHVKRDEALVGAAGPASNLILALLATMIIGVFMVVLGPDRLWTVLQTRYSGVWWVLQLALINLILAGFNLIPIPPLDGSWILSSILPYPVQRFYDNVKRFGPILLLVIFFTPLLDIILLPLINVLSFVFIQLPLTQLAIVLGH